MQTVVDSNSSRFQLRAAQWIERPFLLALLLLAVRSVLYPYAGLIHDALLYGAQTMNRAGGGQLNSDLFFRYGSQDSYSIFSSLASPLASALGLPNAFLLLYVVSSLLFLYASVCIVRRLVDDPILAIASLVILTVADYAYGGWDVFVLHEAFLTPRLAASALVLLAIDQAWDRHWVRGIAFQLAALALHPLMAAAGIGVLLGMWALGRSWSCKSILAFAGLGVAVATTMLIRLSLTPVMDADWLTVVRQISPHCFPSEWRPPDWLNLAVASVAVFASMRLVNIRGRALLASTLVVGLGGLGIAMASEFWPVPLLVQGQAMRALWLLHFAAVPCAIVAAAQWLHSAWILRRIVGCLLAFWVLGIRRLDLLDGPIFWALMTSSILLSVFVARLRDPHSLNRSWFPVVAGMVLGGAIESLASTIGFVRVLNELPPPPDWLTAGTYALRSSGSLLAIGLGLGVLAVLVSWTKSAGAVLLRATVVICVALGATWWIRSLWIQPKDGEDLVHARFLLSRSAIPEQATVYWPTDIRNVWFGLGCPSYLNFVQVQGAVFSRETTMEAAKRRRYTRPFELVEAHLNPWIAANWGRLGRFYGPLDAGIAAPLDAVVAIASDPQLDYVLLDHHVPGIAADRCGPLWLYDCAQIRTALADSTVETNLRPRDNEGENQ